MEFKVDREKLIGLLSTYSTLGTIGIYPQAVVSGDGVRKERTEWQDGHNEGVMKVTSKSGKITRFLQTQPDEIIQLILDNHIDVDTYEGECYFTVNCNDLFAWACADSEEIESDEEMADLMQAIEDCPGHLGPLLWCCRKRKYRPQKPYYKHFTKEQKKLFDACGPKRKD